jgi:pimeloyl-ACP methyl ester carboxylesterase
VYLHGLDAGEWNWDFKAVPGYDYAHDMAGLGHLSVTLDELGYGASGQPANGNLTCVGAEADVVHQVIQQLRSGKYSIDHGRTIRFHRVFLAGHDTGGLIAEVEAYSYADIGGLIEITWADQGHTQFIVQRAVTASAQWCTAGTGTTPQPVSYSDFATESDWHSWLFHDADPRVVAATDRVRNPNPCGVIRGLTAAVSEDNPYSLKNAVADPGNFPLSPLTKIQVPVFVVFGANDTQLWSHQGEAEQQGNFAGSPDRSTVFIPGASHFPMFEKTAPQFVQAMSSWLKAHGA